MGILLVYDVTDERSFNSKHSINIAWLLYTVLSLYSKTTLVIKLTEIIRQISGPGSQTLSSMLPRA